MTVHMFRVFVSQSDSSLTETELQATVEDWISEYTKWDGQSQSFEITLSQGIPGDSDTTHYRGEFRFEKGDTKDNILQKLTDKLDNKVDWYRIGYHECYHDDTGPCSWNDTVQDGSVPGYVPDMN